MLHVLLRLYAWMADVPCIQLTVYDNWTLALIYIMHMHGVHATLKKIASRSIQSGYLIL